MREEWVRPFWGALFVAACGGAVDVGSSEPSAAGAAGKAPAMGGSRPASGPASPGKPGRPVQVPTVGGQSSGGAPQGSSSAGAPMVEAGAGGALDELSFGGAPTYLDDCATDLKQALPRPEVDCPAQMVNDETPCDIPENAGCVWQLPNVEDQTIGYGIASCYATLTGKRWRNYAFSGGPGPLGVNGENCPDWFPVAGSSCAGHAGEICYYPALSCSCAVDGASWSCEVDPGTEGGPAYVGLPVEVKRLCPPDGIDESKQVRELSEAEIVAWCNWHGDPSGAPRPEVIGDDRGTDGYATYGFNIGYDVCLPEIPVELCVHNFHAVRQCTATLGDLDDCVETIRGGGQNDRPAWVGHGCAPLLANPSCAGLVVSSDCVLPLD